MSENENAKELDDPIAAANERQDEYWQRVGGRDEEVTAKVGWKERWELMLKETEGL